MKSVDMNIHVDAFLLYLSLRDYWREISSISHAYPSRAEKPDKMDRAV